MAIFLLVRHAIADAPLDVLLGRSEVGLSNDGIQSARKLARYLRILPIVAVWSSPLLRARQTAQAIADELMLPVGISLALNEVDYGQWTGRSLGELQNDSNWRDFNRLRTRVQIPAGETIRAVERRVIDQLNGWTKSDQAQLIVAVTHAEIIRIAILRCLGLSSDDFDRIEISHACVSVLQWVEPRSQLICLNESGELAALRFVLHLA